MAQSAQAETLLQDVLARQIPVVEDLLTLAYQETEALKGDDLFRLTELNTERQLLLAQLQGLEEQRQVQLTAFQTAKGLPAPPALGELLAFSDVTENFTAIAQTLWDKFHQLREQQELNQMLLNQSLHYTRKMLGIFNYGATYQPDGRIEQPQAANSLLDKSV